MPRAALERARGPFIGPRPYHARDRHLFFGREEETAALVDSWARHRLTVLHGDHGVGKTSLVRAGAVPRLLDRGHTVLPSEDLRFDPVFPSSILPGHNPYTRALLASWAPSEFPTRGPGTSIVDFVRAHESTDRYGRHRPLFAVLDRTELLLRRPCGPDRWRKDFLDELFGALERDDDLHLVLTVRTDHLDELRRLMDKHAISPVEMGLRPFAPDTARSVARSCLEAVGSRIGAAEPDRLVEEALVLRGPDGRVRARRDTVEPALLQILGATLWEEASEDGTTLVPDDIEVDRALTERLAGVLEEVAAEHLVPPDVPHAWLRRLVASGGRGVPGPAHEDPDGSLTPGVVHALEDRYLVATGEDGSSYVLRHPRLAGPLMALALSPYSRGLAPWSDQDRLDIAGEARTRGETALAAEHARLALCSPSPLEPGARALFTTLLADLAFERGEHRAAAEHYADAASCREAVGEGAAVSRLMVAEARARLLSGERSRALSLLTAVGGRAHADPSLRTGIGQVLWSAGQAHSALDVLGAALVGGGGVSEARRTRDEIRAEQAALAERRRAEYGPGRPGGADHRHRNGGRNPRGHGSRGQPGRRRGTVAGRAQPAGGTGTT
ncbi:ATP-binding protein [Nocardiopsis alba]|uniref:nSTAND1 domain-containing NTPase n=1 Tax=Nocardiopsis alba TaxID=53437 RepID=UPI0036711F7A